MYTNPISNILNSITGNKTIYYGGQKNLFSIMLQSMDEWSFINQINQPFSLFITDNPIDYSQQRDNICLQYHTNDMIVFHSKAPAFLKKEDKYILSKKLVNTHKVFFDKRIQESWDIPSHNCSMFNYGYRVLYDGTHTKDVMVLNFNKSPAINHIYETLKDNINQHSIKLITDHTNYNDLLAEILDYKVIISSGGLYESISCAGLGCWVIALEPHDDYPSIMNIDYLHSYNEIMEKTLYIVNQYDTFHKQIYDSQQHIQSSYDNIETMHSNFTKIFSSTSQRAFTYDA